MNKQTRPGFSLLELLMAMAIGGVFLSMALGTVGQIYFSQKQIQIRQLFYAEGRFLMERVVSAMRDNTIDYDRYFEEVGPESVVPFCQSFETEQVPDGHATTNDKATRTSLGYETVFLWDTDDDDNQDRALGGVNLDGDNDPCSQAFWRSAVDFGADGILPTLFLINGDRTVRTAFRWNTTDETLEKQVLLSVDTDNDGTPDQWDLALWDGTTDQCEISGDPVRGEADKKTFCLQAHDWISVSPPRVVVKNTVFEPGPDTDPFLAFRRDDKQVHPHVFVALSVELGEKEKEGFTATNVPRMDLQTAASSRIYGNTRE